MSVEKNSRGTFRRHWLVRRRTCCRYARVVLWPYRLILPCFGIGRVPIQICSWLLLKGVSNGSRLLQAAPSYTCSTSTCTLATSRTHVLPKSASRKQFL